MLLTIFRFLALDFRKRESQIVLEDGEIFLVPG